MIGSIVRSVVAVLVGLIAAMVVVVGNEVLSSVLHPVPPGFDATSNAEMKAHVARVARRFRRHDFTVWKTDLYHFVPLLFR
jgi:hypothetical protein